MLDSLLDAIASHGISEIQKILTEAVESVLKKHNEVQKWKNLMVGVGDFFIQNERDEINVIKIIFIEYKYSI